MARVSSSATDPIALGASILYATGVGVAVACVTAGLTTRTWLLAAGAFVMLVVFAAQVHGWTQAARCRITVDEGAVLRAGPLGWRVARTDVEHWETVEALGRTYLAVVPRAHPPRTAMSRALLGSSMPKGSVVGPLAARSVEAVREALVVPGRCS